MGLFHRNEKEALFAGGSKNVMESIQRANDTGTLIYLDDRQDFNTNSVITVAPNEQVIFIRNGEFYGTLPSGRHEIKTDNYPLLSRIRNMLTGGMSTFTCQVYHVQTNEQKVNWGTSTPIEIQDYFLGNGVIGVPTLLRGAAAFRVRFNINEDDDASKHTFMRLMGDKSTYTVTDLELMFDAEITKKISSVVGKTLENISMQRSINAISSQLEDFSIMLKPKFDEVLAVYGLELVDFSFYNLNIEETDIRRTYINRLVASAHTGGYDKAVQQELLKDIAVNPGAGGVAGLGAGIGMGVATSSAFAQIANSAFDTTQQKQNSAAPSDPVETLSKLKEMLDRGLISQEKYDAKVTEVINSL